MNNCYRAIYNEALGAWVAVSEITNTKGKKSRGAGKANLTAVVVKASMAGMIMTTGILSTPVLAQTVIGLEPASNGFNGISASVLKTTGNNNIGIGGYLTTTTRPSMYVSGNNNVAMGTSAGYSVTGQSNLALGQEAGNTVVGNNNIALGTKAGAGITASDAVSIGSSAKASANNAVAIGTSSSATKENAVAMGKGAVAGTNLGDVAIGAGSKTGSVVNTTSVTIGSTTYSGFAGTTAKSTFSVGDTGSERTVTNVAAGRISNSSTDAINGSQLYAVAAAAKAAGAGWNITTAKETGSSGNVSGASLQAVAPGDTVTVTAGSNITVTQTGADIKVATNQNLFVTSVMAGNSIINNSGLTILDGPSFTTSGINANNTKLTNLADGALTATSKDAINGSQLYAVQQTANAGWNLQANGDAADNIAPGNTVKVVDGSNTTVSYDATANQLKVDIVSAPVFTGSVTAAGFDATDNKITNVADGTVSGTSKDAINGSQLYTVTTRVNQLGTTTASAFGGGATYDADTGTISAPSYKVYNTNVPDVASAITNMITLGPVQFSDASGLPEPYVTSNNVTLVGADTAAPVALHNVADGDVSAASKDAINGSQLYAVQQTANAGWNLQANGGAADNIAPGNTVKVVDGSNTTVSYDATANQLKVDIVNAPVFSGKVTAAGFDATGNKIANVAAGTTATDAVNVAQLTGSLAGLGGGAAVKADGTIQAPSYVTYNADGTTSTVNNVGAALAQLNSQGTKYFHTNSTDPDSKASGTDSTAIGPNAVASATNAVAIGNGATANSGNSVALGAGSTTGAVHTGTLAMNGGTAAGVGSDTFGTVSVGTAAAPRQIQNVAAGVISDTSTDAINGSQLYTVAATANKGWTATTAKVTGSTGSVSGTSNTTIAPGATATWSAGNNIAITQNGAEIQIATNPDLIVTSVTAGNTAIDTSGLTITGGPSVTGTGINAASKKVTNVLAGDVSASSTDAVNGSQLYAIQQTASAGWNLQVNGGAADNIAAGNTVNVVDGSNTAVSYDATTNQLKVGVVNAPVFSGSVKAAGFDATGNTITNVAAGTATTDAVNVAQLTGSLAGLGGGAAVKADGTIQAPSYVTYNADGTTSTVNNVGAALVQLNSQGTKYFHTNSTDPDSKASGTDSTAIGPNAVASATNAVAMGNGATANTGNSVALGAGSTTGAVHTGTLAMNGGTAAGVGSDSFGTVSVGTAAAPRQIQNVAAGVISDSSTDAINGSQLYSVAQTASKGWNATSSVVDGSTGTVNGAEVTNIDPGGTATWSAGNNIAITQNGAEFQIATNPDLIIDSVTAGNTSIDANGLTIDGGPSVTTTGIDAASKKVINVADGAVSADSMDAINGSQLYTVTTTVNELGTTAASAFGGGASYNAFTGKISAPTYNVFGTSVFDVASAITNMITLSPIQFSNAGGTPTPYTPSNHVTLVGATAGTTVVLHNVADGAVTATSTEAINGSQLYSVAATANKGWNVTTTAVDGSTGTVTGNEVSNIAPGGTATWSAGNNIAITQNGSEIQIATNPNLKVTSVTAGNTVIDTSGLTIEGGPSVTSEGINAASSKVINVLNGDVSATSTDAVNGSQLYTVQATANKGWNVTTAAVDGSTGTVSGNEVTNIAPGSTATWSAGNNIAITQNGAEIQIATNPDLIITSVTAGDTVIDTSGLSISGGPSVKKTGIDAAGTVITHVASGQVTADSTDAINGSQLYAVQQTASAGWNLQANGGEVDNIAPGDMVNVVNGSNTTVAYDAATNQLQVNVVDAPVFAGSVTAAGFNATGNKVTNVAVGTATGDAVNVGQLTGTLAGLGGGAAVKTDGTIQAPSYVTYNADGSTTTVNNVGSALAQINSQGTKYFHTNSTGADSQALGADSTAIGPNAVAGATNAVAMGNGAKASTANGVALGAGSETGAVHTGTLALYGGTAAGVGSETFGTVSVGSAAAPRQVQNVAAGVISATSTDAINGSQLNTVAVGVNQLGTTAAAALGGGSTFNTATGAINAPTYNVIGGSATSVGAAVTNLITQAPVQYSTSTGTPTPYTPSNNVTLVGASAGPVSLNNVAPAELSATSTQAVNGSQLFATNNAVGAVQNQVNGLQTTLSPIIQNISAAESRGSGATGVVSGAGVGGGNHLTQTHETLRGTVDPVIRVNAADCTTATGYDTTSVGLCARSGNGDGSQTSGATAIGSSAWALNYNSTAIGFRATATAANSVALGANSVANEANTVSVGSAGNERRVTNVAEGVHGTDAVNVNQLQTAYAGIAMSVSLNSVHIPTLAPGEQGFGAGLGYYKGKTAFGAFYRSVNETGNRAIGGGVATDGKDFTVNVGIGWKWK